MWQEVIVGICVIAAVLFLLRKWFFNTQKSGCGGCSGSSSCSSTPGPSCGDSIKKNND